MLQKLKCIGFFLARSFVGFAERHREAQHRRGVRAEPVRGPAARLRRLFHRDGVRLHPAGHQRAGQTLEEHLRHVNGEEAQVSDLNLLASTAIDGILSRWRFTMQRIDWLHLFFKDWRDVEAVAEVSGRFLQVWRMVEDLRENRRPAKLFWSSVHCRKGRAEKVWGMSFIFTLQHLRFKVALFCFV